MLNNNRKKLNLEEKYHIFYQIQNLNSQLALGDIYVDTEMKVDEELCWSWI